VKGVAFAGGYPFQEPVPYVCKEDLFLWVPKGFQKNVPMGDFPTAGGWL